MIRIFDFAQAVEADPRTEYHDCKKRKLNAYGGTPRTGSSKKQIVGYGGSYKRDVVQTTRTEYHDCYTPLVGIAMVEQTPWSNDAEVCEWTNRIKNENKKTGSYERVTMKEKMTKGKTHVEKSTGRYGIADEQKRSSTIKIGDKSGYTEYYHEDRVRRVNYGGSKSTGRLCQGNKNTNISVSHGSGNKKNTSIKVNHGKNKSTSVSINYGNKKSSSCGKGKAKNNCTCNCGY